VSKRQKQRAAEAQKQKTRNLYIAATAVVVVVLAVVGLVIVKVAGGDSKPKPAAASNLAPASVVDAVSNWSPDTLNAIGDSGALTVPKPISGPPLKENGKPLVVYIGAEFCPFCAAERWAMVASLARFGTWHNLGATHSSTSDIYPNTATFSFHGADYTSQYVSFQGKETESNVPENGGYAPLDTLTPEQDAMIRKYDAPPYVSSADAGSIPFINFANQYLVAGASYDPQVLQGLTMPQIAAELKNPKSDVAHAIGGTTNALTAAICGTTNQQPASVCTQPAVKAAATRIGG
jgi:Domain of unknown function (DUF929)